MCSIAMDPLCSHLIYAIRVKIANHANCAYRCRWALVRCNRRISPAYIGWLASDGGQRLNPVRGCKIGGRSGVSGVHPATSNRALNDLGKASEEGFNDLQVLSQLAPGKPV